MSVKMKPCEHYVITAPNGEALALYGSVDRLACIRNFVMPKNGLAWGRWYRKGYRCRKVKLVEVRK